MNAAEYPLRIENLSIRNYKGIDALDLEFPLSPISGSPDVVAIGSRNGVGKSSVLECCAIALAIPGLLIGRSGATTFEGVDDIVRVGAKSAEIFGRVMRNEKRTTFRLTLGRGGAVTAVDGDTEIADQSTARVDEFEHMGTRANLFPYILGQTSDPVLFRNCVLFHSFRRISGGHVESDKIFKSSSLYDLRPFDDTSSRNLFKAVVVREMMYDAGLVENAEPRKDHDRVLDKLKELIKQYTGGELGKLRVIEDDEIDIRIEPIGQSKSFTFNALSSGQIEVISTLFLIWHATRDAPSVVLIDEPELHLNAEWHGSFVSTLLNLAPRNQYILATHSEDVMASVAPECRIILTGRDAARE